MGNGADGRTVRRGGHDPGDSPHTLTGADGTIWHPTGRWAATVVRLCGGIAILDAENNFNPVAFLQFNKDSPDQYPVERIDDDHWEVVFDKIFSPGHEIGFSPDGRFLCMMNNLRENNCSVFDVRDPDPTKWKKIAHVEDPLWGGKYPEPVPHGVLARQLEALSVGPASVAGGERRHGGRHRDLDDHEGNPGHRSRPADAGASPTTASMCWRRSAASSGSRAASR